MKTAVVVAGTRPEVIKLAPVIMMAQDAYRQQLLVRLCLTGQHASLAQEALAIFKIQPDVDLHIMREGQSINDVGRAVFEALPTVLERFKADLVVVQGDTTTAATSALCAFHLNIPVAHIEAGLRSHNLHAPFPEEANRKVIATIASYHFCPTVSARENLLSESVPEGNIHVTGNTVVDALEYMRRTCALDDVRSVVPNLQGPFVLVTAHRRESFGTGLQHICRAIQTCARQFPDRQFVYPVHLNPNVRDPVMELLDNIKNVSLIKPVSYLQLLTLLKHCEFVLTDSGGIQEEAPTFGKYCIVLRDVTERMESVRLGISELVGTDVDKIVTAVSKAMDSKQRKIPTVNPYGDGKASGRILEVLCR
ncbi:MAG: UDP-N-acetylglucosamine 2-epimerase (non-hydrolyzing) [Bacteroidota bacterium]